MCSNEDQGLRSLEEKDFELRDTAATRDFSNQKEVLELEHAVDPGNFASNMSPEEIAKCWSVLEAVRAKPIANQFQSPVRWQEYDLQDYPQIIKNPMDLQTVSTKLTRRRYTSMTLFVEDMRLILSNATLYNRTELKYTK